MDKEKFREIRLALNLSADGLSKIIGFKARTIRDWENLNNDHFPHPSVVPTMERLASGWRPPEFEEKSGLGRKAGKLERK